MATTSTKGTKIVITRRALVQRINRKLSGQGFEVLKGNRGRLGAGRDDLGRYFRVDEKINAVLDRDVDIEKLGRDLGVIRGYERVEEESE